LRHLIGKAAALGLIVPALVSAHSRDHQSRAVGYVFVGAGAHNMGLTTGFGGEGYVYKGLGVGASANDNSNLIGVGSADLSYHFFLKKGKVAPVVAGGYTLFFGQDTDVGTGSIAHGANVGGGVDIFASKHAGLRLDVRYNAHGDHILWASFPDTAQFSFVAFRIGVTFR